MAYRIPLALAILCSAFIGMTASAQATGSGSCSGRLIDVRELRFSKEVIGEAAVYYNRRTGKNCLRTNRRGSAAGSQGYTVASISRCETVSRFRGEEWCDFSQTWDGKKMAEDRGVYLRYAGPVSVYAPRNCVQVVAEVETAGQTVWTSFVTGCPVRG